MITIKSAEEIKRMQASADIAAAAMEKALSAVKEGVTTQQIDDIVFRYIINAGATPSFKGYNGFPGSACISLNEEIVHGIPGPRVLQEGDIISIDLGAYFHGYHSDMARTIGVGKISAEAQELIDVTKQSFFDGIAQAVVGNRIMDISKAIEAAANKKGYGVIRELIGHGVGQDLHEAPDVPNYAGFRKGPVLRAGMTLAVEPMFSLGSREMITEDDGWTAVTKDRSLSAHYENTIVIAEEGPPYILTIPGERGTRI